MNPFIISEDYIAKHRPTLSASRRQKRIDEERRVENAKQKQIEDLKQRCIDEIVVRIVAGEPVTIKKYKDYSVDFTEIVDISLSSVKGHCFAAASILDSIERMLTTAGMNEKVVRDGGGVIIYQYVRPSPEPQPALTQSG